MEYLSTELDITYCNNENCSKRKQCLRGLETKTFDKICIANFVCGENFVFFIPIKKEI